MDISTRLKKGIIFLSVSLLSFKKSRFHLTEDSTTPSEEAKELTPETPSPETEVKQLEDICQGAAEDDVKESWDAEDDVKDEWDASDDENESGNL